MPGAGVYYRYGGVQMTRTHRLIAATMLPMFSLCLHASSQAPAQASPQASTPDGLQLLHKMQSALGGAEKIAAIQDYEETVVAQTWNNAGTPMGEVRKRTRWMRDPNLLRLDQRGPGATYVLFFDGGSGSGWEMLPDRKSADKFKTSGEAIELVGGELQFAKNYLSGFDINLWLADRNPVYTVTSPAQNVLRIAHDMTAVDLTLDAATLLPVKTASVSLADPDRPVPSELRIGAWTTIDGVRFPTLRANYHSGVKMAEETVQGTIRLNAGLSREALASKPADFAPEIP
jgi:hypothetical protein